jgi:hypothetical protein
MEVRDEKCRFFIYEFVAGCRAVLSSSEKLILYEVLLLYAINTFMINAQTTVANSINNYPQMCFPVFFFSIPNLPHFPHLGYSASSFEASQ